jgi:hypothetical protein
MTRSPFRDHFPYQNGPVERCRMNGREAGFGLIDDHLNHRFGRNGFPGNPPGNPFRATLPGNLLGQKPPFQGHFTTSNRP